MAVSCRKPKIMSPTAPRALVLIPARMASTRLPGKPLAMIAGKPMIVHVLERARQAGLGEPVVATDAPEVAQAVQAHGGKAVMTRADHPSGSDRIFEALQTLDPDGQVEIVVNVQGDLPTLDPSIIQKAAALMDDPAVDIATLATVIDNETDRTDPNVPKVVATPLTERHLRALYFTRVTAPYGDGPHYFHISGSTCTAAPRWSALSACRRRPWNSARSWNNCAPSKRACASTLPSWMVYRLASIRRTIWKKPDDNSPQATGKDQRNEAVVPNAQSALRQKEK
jgi:3-deoxy-manno-octulosonate cytidylyltransferase (CMP-KDO synthetase)